MTERQCWAYGPNGRCHHPAGHPGDHIIEITWTDNECVTPGQPAPSMTGISPAPAVQEPVQVVQDEEPEACIACNHMHKGGECRCGCYNHV